MLRNNLTLALRRLARQRLATTIQVAGLAVGLALCLLVLTYLRSEWQYDTFHERAGDTYLLHAAGDERHGKRWVRTAYPLVPALQEQVPAVERAVRIWPEEKTAMRLGQAVYPDVSGLSAEPAFLEVFSFPAVAGDLAQGLGTPDAIVLSSRLATRLFGGQDPIGRTVGLQSDDGFHDLSVTTVVDVPSRSSIQFDYLIPAHWVFRPDLRDHLLTQWGGHNFYTFVQLASGHDLDDVRRRLAAFGQRHRDRLGEGHDRLDLLPLRDLHLTPWIRFDLGPTTDPAHLWILGGIAAAVLLIACANGVNLSLGLAVARLREIGVRKVLGGTRADLVRLLWGEAALLCGLSLVLGAALAELCLPVCSDLVGRDLAMDAGGLGLGLAGLGLSTGLLAGAYPALVLSAVRPAALLRGHLQPGGRNRVGRVLVVAQYAVSILLIAVVLVMWRQLAYLRGRDLGFDAERVVVVDTYGLGRAEQERTLAALRQADAAHPELSGVTMANMSFARGGDATQGAYQDRAIAFATYVIDYDFLATLGVDLREGRDFSPRFAADASESILVNAAFLRALGWEHAVGRPFPLDTGRAALNGVVYDGRTIVGVVDGFHHESLHHAIDPAAFTLQRGNGSLRYLLVRTGSGPVAAAVGLIRDTYERANPDSPLVYSFLDDDVARAYRAEERWLRLVAWSAGLAIAIACLGLFGLAAQATARRTREIGVRKALGATAAAVLLMLCRQFVALAVAGLAIAWPLGHYTAGRWLESFAYRIDLGPAPFAAAGLLAVAAALGSVGYQALRAARANPVDALRAE